MRKLRNHWVIHAILRVTRADCQWRMLSADFPKWQTMYGVFWKWRREKLWQEIHDTLREKVRQAAGKKPTPTVAIIDSHSVRAAEGGKQRGYDAGKKVTDRKRHLAVDSLGLLPAIVVAGADWRDQHGACRVPEKLHTGFRRIKVIFGDSA